MSEVKRYYLGKYGLVEGAALGRIGVVLVADFDQVAAERDALQQQQARRRAATIEALKPENQRIVPCNETPPTDYFKCMKGE